MDKNTCTSLAQNAAEGDKEAFEKLYTELRPRIYFFILKNVGSESDAQDILQETFVTAFEKLPALKDKSAFSAWVYRIAYTKCMDTLKQRSDTRYTDIDDMPLKEMDKYQLQNPVMLPEEYAEDRELRARLKQTIEALDTKMRSAVILYYYEEMSVSETAKTLGISESAVKARLYKARKKIGREIESFTGGKTLCAVPLGAVVGLSFDDTSAAALAKGGAVKTAFGLKIAAGLAAGAVVIGVPAAMHFANTREGFGGEKDSNSVLIIDSSTPDTPDDPDTPVMTEPLFDTDKVIYSATAVLGEQGDYDGVEAFFITEDGSAFTAVFHNYYTPHPYGGSFLEMYKSGDDDLVMIEDIGFVGRVDTQTLVKANELIALADTAKQYQQSEVTPAVIEEKYYNFCIYPEQSGKRVCFPIEDRGKNQGLLGMTSDGNAWSVQQLIEQTEVFKKWYDPPYRDNNPEYSEYELKFTLDGRSVRLYDSDTLLKFIYQALDNKHYDILSTAENRAFSNDEAERCRQSGLFGEVVFKAPADITVCGKQVKVTRITFMREQDGDGIKISLDGGSVMTVDKANASEILQLAGVPTLITHGFEIADYDKERGYFYAFSDGYGLAGFAVGEDILQGDDSISPGDYIYITWDGSVAESYPGQIYNVSEAYIIREDNDFVGRHWQDILDNCKDMTDSAQLEEYIKAYDDLTDGECSALVWLASSEFGIF